MNYIKIIEQADLKINESENFSKVQSFFDIFIYYIYINIQFKNNKTLIYKCITTLS